MWSPPSASTSRDCGRQLFNLKLADRNVEIAELTAAGAYLEEVEGKPSGSFRIRLGGDARGRACL